MHAIPPKTARMDTSVFSMYSPDPPLRRVNLILTLLFLSKTLSNLYNEFSAYAQILSRQQVAFQVTVVSSCDQFQYSNTNLHNTMSAQQILLENRLEVEAPRLHGIFLAE